MAQRLVVILTHQKLCPPKSRRRSSSRPVLWQTELDVERALVKLGFHVEYVGFEQDLLPVLAAIRSAQPFVVMNLAEEFNYEAVLDANLTAAVEALGVRLTGCNPRGLWIARHKILAKQIAVTLGVQTPRYVAVSTRREIARVRVLQFPVIVKLACEEASLKLSQASVAATYQKCVKRIEYLLATHGGEVLIEEFVAGRELTVGVLDGAKPQIFWPWELHLASERQVASAWVKWNAKHRQHQGIRSCPARRLTAAQVRTLRDYSLRLFQGLQLSGYARMDFRMNQRGQIFFIEANPNPNLSRSEDFAASARRSGYTYEQLLEHILGLARRYRRPS